jgi:quercetin dioxygenase-like cupin family protein
MPTPRSRASGSLLEENERVIITEWRLAPGAETGWHRHQHDYVVVCLTAGKLLAETANGDVETELRFGQTYARPSGVPRPGEPLRFLSRAITLGCSSSSAAKLGVPA